MKETGEGTQDHSTIFVIIVTFCKSIIIWNIKIKRAEKNEGGSKKRKRMKKKQFEMNTDNLRDE